VTFGAHGWGTPKAGACLSEFPAKPLKLTDGSRAFLVGLPFDVGDQSGEVRWHGVKGSLRVKGVGGDQAAMTSIGAWRACLRLGCRRTRISM
jgi:hypothetical protein